MAAEFCRLQQLSQHSFSQETAALLLGPAHRAPVSGCAQVQWGVQRIITGGNDPRKSPFFFKVGLTATLLALSARAPHSSSRRSAGACASAPSGKIMNGALRSGVLVIRGVAGNRHRT
jgi:hypothetical protein